MTNQLFILNSSIRQLDGLYSLNDLHKISGNEDKHLPFRFMRLEQTQELIAEIQSEFKTPDLVFKITKGRGIQGTYACKELVIAYAAWISPQFHLVVLRAFLDRLENSQNAQQNLPLAKPEIRYPAEFTGAEIYSLVWLLISNRNMNELLGELEHPLAAIGSNFHPTVYSHHREYKHLIDEALPILKRLIEPFKESNPVEFERIKARLKLN
ncbi:MAG: P22AR C-terminal domain-containing protein [[Pasteurella] mairii]|uniref:KilA domain-containing protein n=1 Tax=[Pasteurella] mairii TaxID=757 RepID=A0A379B0Q2_9PAST|nr:P22AR C-terminal domain-containing protein [[Pasteurella] mairii]SUB28750.1 KilA domain-containing protein [[Pasteurella] mairii]SUB33375.1 KilA domain-containing protein [[Pasteurella] mairii]